MKHLVTASLAVALLANLGLYAATAQIPFFVASIAWGFVLAWRLVYLAFGRFMKEG